MGSKGRKASKTEAELDAERLDRGKDRMESFRVPAIWDTISNLINHYEKNEDSGSKEFVQFLYAQMEKTFGDPNYKLITERMYEVLAKASASLIQKAEFKSDAEKCGISATDIASAAFINMVQRGSFDPSNPYTDVNLYDAAEKAFIDMRRSIKADLQRAGFLDVLENEEIEWRGLVKEYKKGIKRLKDDAVALYKERTPQPGPSKDLTEEFRAKYPAQKLTEDEMRKHLDKVKKYPKRSARKKKKKAS